ncbi:phosphatidylinositol glycan, class O [Cryptococcus wingfieldii CBS 7118]|uniref:Phosphatidylinositol glycan, class O n=1 Tax=Cryptococcus wingfieldii CBS 7118 TaxID=1295528 RepID=A0A1E3JZZ4_9TREE|nr:phosphatidylinositol glycan, class O [Cryptococcus wingfieldii CBS 7118]ODO06343.1 phosphatidylinositol glycan, class O [Cryptococcus wingfieldii CBS 7118]
MARSTAWLRSISRQNLAAIIVLYIAALHLIGLYLFTQGFLLNRVTIPHISPAYEETIAPTHSKAVVIVIDALRTDFISPHYPEPFSPHHHGVLTVAAELTQSHPEHSLIFNAYSDPPTSTMQRIKGITTGSLPTFIDISSNFASTAIDEDSLVHQLVAANKTVGFMGDDTWMNLFPSSFHPDMSHPYDSFNVEDLHTVDNGVIEHIFPYLHPDNQSSWDVLIGHFLGVDHAGHRVGPFRETMGTKLAQMDDVLRKVVDQIDDDTLLVVLGDHGMDDKGNHGGDSELEVASALWLYSKGAPIATDSSALRLGAVASGWPMYTYPGSSVPIRHVNQIDIVPTISLLLGIPIPFNNLGSVIPECFGKDLETLELAQRLNAEGIWRFIEAYGDRDVKRGLEDVWKHAVSQTDDLEKSIIAHRTFTLAALSSLRALWAQFSVPLIILGSLVLVLSFFTLVALYVGVRNNGVQWDVYARLALETAIMGSGVLASVAGTVAGVYTRKPIVAIKVFVVAAAIISEVILILPLLVKFSTPSSFTINRYAGPIILAAHALSFASNSFIMWEDRVVLYLVITIPIIYLFKALSAPTADMRLKIIFLSLAFTLVSRLASAVTVCREEQQPYCSVTFFSGVTPTAPTWALMAILFVAFQLPRAIGITLANSKALAGPAPFMLGVLWRVVVLSNAVYWMLEFLESYEDLNPSKVPIVSFVKMWIARCSMGASLGAIPYVWLTSPLCISVERTADQATGEEEVTVFGFANALGSTYLLYILGPFALVHLVTQPMGQLTLAAWLVGLLVYLELVDTRRDAIIFTSSFSASAENPAAFDPSALSATIARPTFTEVVPLVLAGFLTFFATGHQAVISSIQWKTAFVGFSSASYLFSPILVILNTWGAFFLTALCAPLLAVWNISPRPRGSIPVLAHGLQVVLAFLIYHTLIAVASAITAAWLRRHLMVWKVFAPRFMMSGVTLLVVDVGVILGLVGLRVVSWKVKKTFGCESV